MLSFDYKEKVINELIGNKLEIVFVDGDEETITEANMYSESMKLKQAICDESELKFGGCIASEFDIDLINTADRSFTNSLEGKWISVRLTQTFPTGEGVLPSAELLPSANLLPGEIITTKVWYLFSGYISSAEIDKNDKNLRHVVAYDAFAKMFEWDATNKLFALWQAGGANFTTLIDLCVKNENLAIGYNPSALLDEIIDTQTGTSVLNFTTLNEDWLNDSDTISYGEILKNICEMVGLFGFIRPNSGKGVFNMLPMSVSNVEEYKFYEQLYAAETTSLGYTTIYASIGGSQRSSKVWRFDPVDTPDDAVEHIYDMTDNILAWQSEDTSSVHPMNSLYNGNSGKRLYNSSYAPITASLDGRPWVEVGDRIQINVIQTDTEGNYIYDVDGVTPLTETIESYVLSRTLSGIQALTDKIEAKGE